MSVILMRRVIIAVLALEQLFDGCVDERGVARRAGEFELAHRTAAASDQERRRAGEAVGLRRFFVDGDLLCQFLVVAIAGPLREVQPGHLFGDALEVAFGDVAAVLFALLVVYALDEVPGLVLLAGGQRGDLLGFEDFRFARGRLQRAVFDPQLARAHPLGDDRGKGAERDLLADRALQVAEVLERDGRGGRAEHVGALGDAADEVADRGGRRRDFGFAFGEPGFGFAAGGDQHDDDHNDHHRDHDPELRQARAPSHIGRVGLLHRLALSPRRLAALLARQISLVPFDRAHGETITGFFSTVSKYRWARVAPR